MEHSLRKRPQNVKIRDLIQDVKIHDLVQDIIVSALSQGPDKEAKYVILGEKAKVQLIRGSKKDIDLCITELQKNPLNYTQLSVIADEILKNVQFDALRIVFNKFSSAVSFVPTVSTILSPEIVERESEAGGKLGELDAYGIEGGESKSEILQNLSEFQFSCISNHPELIKLNPKDETDKQKKDAEFSAAVLSSDIDVVGGNTQTESFMGLNDVRHCGKMGALEKFMLSWVSRGDKILLFSHSVRMLDILDKFLIRKGYCFSRLDLLHDRKLPRKH